MAQTARILKSALTWTFILLGVSLGILGLACLAITPVFGYPFRVEGLCRIAVLATLGAAPLLASLVALRSRKRAAFPCFLAVPGTMAVLGPQGGALLALGGIISGVFISLGLFWLGTHLSRWPELNVAQTWSTRRKVAVALASCLLLFLSVLMAAIPLKLHEFFMLDCGEAAPFVRPQFPDQAVFVARVIHVDPMFGAVALVEHHYWGLPWWSRRLVLLHFGRPKDVIFVDGRRADGLLTHFLPVVERRCGRTNFFKDAEVDLRVLNDGPPKNGVRVIGRVSRWIPGTNFDYAPVSGLEVVVAGTAGTFTAITDQHGIYDISGLPPGRYSVSAEAANGKGLDSYRCPMRSEDLRSGDVWGCDPHAEPRRP